jgi:hypothetical protein
MVPCLICRAFDNVVSNMAILVCISEMMAELPPKVEFKRSVEMGA